jgi:hypothetical protein
MIALSEQGDYPFNADPEAGAGFSEHIYKFITKQGIGVWRYSK